MLLDNDVNVVVLLLVRGRPLRLVACPEEAITFDDTVRAWRVDVAEELTRLGLAQKARRWLRAACFAKANRLSR